MTEPAQPPASGMAWSGRARIVGVDATRGVALLGMIGVHSLYESTDIGRASRWYGVFGGRSAAAFAVLAGVAIGFMTRRRRVDLAEARPTVAALGVRAVSIGVIGLALGYTDASIAAVILPAYAVMFVLAIPLVFLPTWVVAVLGVVVAGGMPALGHLLLPGLSPPSLDNPTVGYLLSDPLGLLAELTLTGEYPALSWMAYVCAGLVIGRLDLSRRWVALGLIVAGAALAAGASLASSALLHRYGGLAAIWAAQPGSVLTADETTDLLGVGGDGTVPSATWWWLAVDRPHTGTPPDLLGTTGTAIGVLGLALLAGCVTRPVARRVTSIVLAPLAAAGSMTLSIYTLHILFINSAHDDYQPMTGYLMQVVAVLLIGLGWRATAGRGPLEALVGALSGRAQLLSTRRHPMPRTLTAQDRVTAADAVGGDRA
jgi:uncharacterized membrane protein